MTASPFNEKAIAEFHAKRGRGVGMWGDDALLMTAKGAKTGHDAEPGANRPEPGHRSLPWIS